MKYWIGVAALALFSTPAQAEDWRLATDTDEYPAVVIFVDIDSVSRSGDTVELKLAMYVEGDTAATDEYYLQNWSANCVSGVYFKRNTVTYVGGGMTQQTTTPSTPITVLEGAMDKGVVDAACGKRAYLTGKIVDPAGYASDFFEDLSYDGW